MAWVEINPDYQEKLEQLGLTTASHFLNLPGVIVSGHPDRHVVQVRLGNGPEAIHAYLKREHRVAWRDRVLNALDGFGWVSKSVREAALLKALAGAGIGCAEFIAAGEDDRGRAFLLVRELTGFVDLRVFLRDSGSAPATERRRFARRLGETLARVHGAGFDHPDLYSKHV